MSRLVVSLYSCNVSACDCNGNESCKCDCLGDDCDGLTD